MSASALIPFDAFLLGKLPKYCPSKKQQSLKNEVVGESNCQQFIFISITSQSVNKIRPHNFISCKISCTSEQVFVRIVMFSKL